MAQAESQSRLLDPLALGRFEKSAENTEGVEMSDKVERPFRKIAFPRFNPVAVANELLNPSQTYRGRSEVLFAGLGAWVVVPGCSDLRNDAVRIAARRIYDRACDDLLVKQDVEKSEALPSKWRKKELRVFRARIYDVLGGHARMYETVSTFDLDDQIESKSANIYFIIRLAEIWHYLIETGSLRGNRKLSIAKGADLAGKIGAVNDNDKHHKVSGREVERFWEEMRASIAFSYAASTIRIPEAGTILDQLRENRLTFDQAQPYLTSWFGRAKYVNEKILAELAKPNPKGTRYHPLRPHTANRFPDLSTLKVDCEKFGMPTLSRQALVEVEIEYGKPESGSR